MKGPRFEQWEQREAGVLGTLPFVLLAICLAVSFLIGEADTNAPLWVLSAVSVGDGGVDAVVDGRCTATGASARGSWSCTSRA